MKKSTQKNVIFIAVLGAAYVVITHATKKAVTQKIEKITSDASAALDPTNAENIIYKTENKIIQSATGKQDTTLGSEIYDIFHHQNGDFKFPWQKTKRTF